MSQPTTTMSPKQRAQQAHLKRMLAHYSDGLISGERYRILKQARDWAQDNGAEFPQEYKEKMTRASQDLLRDSLDYYAKLKAGTR